MAALIFMACSFADEFFRVGCVFLESGGSLKKCSDYIKTSRQQILLEHYLSEYCDEHNQLKLNEIRNIKNSLKNDTFKYFLMENYDIEVIDGFEVLQDATFYDSIDPHLVYSNNNLNEIHQGSNFTIIGNILPNCERFSINFALDTPTNDIALHVNPRLPQNYIVRNCRIKNVWGTEEVTSALPFSLHRGSKFTIQILITENEYLISINGRHFASFRHRLPYKNVRCLEVKGDVENVHVEQTIVSQYPEQLPETEPKVIQNQTKLALIKEKNHMPLQPSVSLSLEPPKIDEKDLIRLRKTIELPYYGILTEPLLNGKRLNIEGRVKILPHSFVVNLQKGQEIWPHPIIAFHLNPRFANVGGKHIICRNSWMDGVWGREERTEQKTDFTPGKSFILSISCTANSYEVFLNDKMIAEYQFRMEPNIVDTIYLQGDIKLWDISLEDTKHHTNITNNTNVTNVTNDTTTTGAILENNHIKD